MIRIDSPDGGPGEPPLWLVAVLLYAGGLRLLVVLAFFAGAGIEDAQCTEDASDRTSPRWPWPGPSWRSGSASW